MTEDGQDTVIIGDIISLLMVKPEAMKVPMIFQQHGKRVFSMLISEKYSKILNNSK